MKRLHVHLSVPCLETAIEFYSNLFGHRPSSTRSDYAKWMLDDPRVNFAISRRGAPVGLDHLGIEVESSAELAAVSRRMDAAGEVFDQGEATCCYAESEKAWVHDPIGTAWEAFHTTGESTRYGADSEASEARIAGKATADTAGTLPMIQDTDGPCCAPEKE